MEQLQRISLKIKRLFFGMKGNDGLLYKAIIYFLLISLAYVFLYPLFYMVVTSLKSNLDLATSSVQWIPTHLHWSNYKETIQALNIPKSYFTSLGISGMATLAVVFSSALTGYGLSRFKFRGRTTILIVMIITFITPKMLFFVPRFIIFNRLGLMGNWGAVVIPATLGQGLQSAFFILIFYQFFSMLPKQLEEAAMIDGASTWTIFRKIAVPTAGPAFIITLIYCFSIYWNEISLYTGFLKGSRWYDTSNVVLMNLEAKYNELLNGSDPVNSAYTEAKAFAGTIITILPLMVFYLIVQRWFVESVDKSGITGE